MLKRFAAILLCTSILTSTLPPASTDSVFSDVQDHWAAEYIQTVYSMGLFSGTTTTTFSPEQKMTRGMFVTVLGRFADIDAEDWKNGQVNFNDVKSDAYYAPYINWAVRNSVAKGTSDFTFSPNESINREQMATMVSNFARFIGYQFKPSGDEIFTGDFTDEKSISSWAANAVDLLQLTGIISGIANEDGSFSFAPKNPLTRAQACVIFCKLNEALVPDNHQVMPTGVKITNAISELEKGKTYLLKAEISPLTTTNQTLTWTSSNPSVIRVSLDGLMQWQGAGSATITVSTCNRKIASIIVNAQPDDRLASAYESYTQKCIRIFGKYVEDPRLVYKSPSEAEKHLKTITVKAWDISNGKKYTRTHSVTVHENIAATVEQIFTEIYQLPSKPPINVMGGYSYSSKSEHSPGLALDINPNENYYCDPYGNAIVGSFFDPKRSEYSFPVDGDVERIFQKYGFTRGIYWRSGYKDYMHFSFFGT